MPEPFTSPAVVVGVDGSRAGVRAALWAIPEAASREIPLRLVSSVESAGSNDDARGHGAAEAAIREALTAVEATERPVKIDTDIVEGRPTATLLEASRTAAMLCVGAVGIRHLEHNRVGSTAAALVADAHCPVAIIRDSERVGPRAAGWVVAELDESPDSATVLACGVEEARLRGAALRVLGSWQSRYTDVHDSHAVADGNRMVRARLDRRLSHWRHRYPDLDVRPVPVHGSALHYLAKHANEIQLVVVGARNAESVGELIGPVGLGALHNTDCSILIADRQHLL